MMTQDQRPARAGGNRPMGVFDDLTVECELPDGFDPTGVSFQTKDTAEQWMVRYVLREDGTLWNTKSSAPEEIHGTMEFYTGNWAGSMGGLYMTRDDLPPWTAEYVALFDHGRLVKIEGGRIIVEDVEHVLRADFNRRCEELRKSLAKPGDDLRGEWIHWFALDNRPRFEAVKWPALEVRMNHLWSKRAWGSGRKDSVQELRNWSAWLSQEDGLTSFLVDLLARTVAFLASVGEAAIAKSAE